MRAVEQRLREELAKLKVEINEEKSKIVDLAKGGSFTFLGFEYRRILQPLAQVIEQIIKRREELHHPK